MRRGLNSRFARLMRDGNQDGGPPNAGGGGSGGGGQNQGQGGAGGNNGGQGGQNQDQGLDNLFDDVDDDGGQGGGQGGSGQGGDQGATFSQAQMQQITQLFESGFDRRITQMNQRRRRSQNQPPANQQQNDSGQQNQAPAAPQQPVVDAGARREARIAFRDYITDEMQGRFVSAMERQAAMAFGQNLVSGWDGDGDADEFGREAARQVAQTIRGLRDHYRDLTVRQLRKRGLLTDQGQQSGGQATLGGTVPGAGSIAPVQLPEPTKAAKAVQAAVGLAGEFNARNGHQVQQPATTGA